MLDMIAKVNGAINGVVWGIPMLILIIGTGIYMTVRTKFFQITHAGHVSSKTIGGVFQRGSGVTSSVEKASISQFQALCTALAATIGVGNIAGVAAAIAAGGPGAIFWMWLSAFFGMMTNYSEKSGQPHPEDGAGTSGSDRRGDACDIADADRRRKGGAQRLKL